MLRPLDGEGPDPAGIARTWLGSYPPGVPPTYRYPEVLLTRFLDDAVRDFPDVTAVDAPSTRLSYPQLVDVVDRFVGVLEGLGVHHGVSLGLVLPPGPTRVVACFAAWRLGAVVVPIDPGRSDTILQARLAATDTRVVVAQEDQVSRLRRLRAALPSLHQIVSTSDRDWWSRPRRLLHVWRRGGPPDDVLSFGEVVQTTAPRAPQRHADPGDTAAVLFDEDGVAVPLTHRHLVVGAFQARLWVPDVQAGRERVLTVGPADHAAGLVHAILDPVLSAATIVTADDDPAAVSARVADVRVTLLRAPTTTYASLVRGGGDHTSLRACLAYGDVVDAELVDHLADVTGGARLRQIYGSVAACGTTHANPVYGRSVPGTVGLPVTDTLSCVVDQDDPQRVLPAGEAGRLLVRGPQVALGQGWLDTGDLACVDASGVFTLVEGGTLRP